MYNSIRYRVQTPAAYSWAQNFISHRIHTDEHDAVDRSFHGTALSSVAVSVAFEGAINLHSNVVCLLLAEPCELSAQRRQVQIGHLLIQGLGQQVYFVLVSPLLLGVH